MPWFSILFYFLTVHKDTPLPVSKVKTKKANWQIDGIKKKKKKKLAGEWKEKDNNYLSKSMLNQSCFSQNFSQGLWATVDDFKVRGRTPFRFLKGLPNWFCYLNWSLICGLFSNLEKRMGVWKRLCQCAKCQPLHLRTQEKDLMRPLSLMPIPWAQRTQQTDVWLILQEPKRWENRTG